jgi:hypothetical protein
VRFFSITVAKSAGGIVLDAAMGVHPAKGAERRSTRMMRVVKAVPDLVFFTALLSLSEA